MNELHILNVGRADCSVFFLDSEQGKKTVVLDGGELSWRGHQPLLEFLEEREIKTVDLMILTHLHQDHFGGFYQHLFRAAGKSSCLEKMCCTASILRRMLPCGRSPEQRSFAGQIWASGK